MLGEGPLPQADKFLTVRDLKVVVLEKQPGVAL